MALLSQTSSPPCGTNGEGRESREKGSHGTTPARTRWRGRGAVWSLLASAWLLGCGGGGGQAEPTAVDPPPPAGRESALAVSQPGELARWAQDKLRTRLAQGQAYVPPGLSVGAVALPADFIPVASTNTNTSAAPTAAAPAERSTTLAQEAGVDEADLLHSDGRHLYALQQNNRNSLRVQVYARSTSPGANPQSLSSVLLADTAAQSVGASGMHLNVDATALTVLSQSWQFNGDVMPCVGVCPAIALPVPTINTVGVQRVDISNPAAASARDRLNIDGTLLDSRRIGDTLYVVMTHRPRLALDSLPANASAAQREAAIAATTAADILPKLRRNGGAAEPLLADTDCFVQQRNGSLDIQITTITVFDLKSPSLARSSRCFLGGSEAVYMSAGSLYLATTRWNYPVNAVGITPYPAEIRTDLHKFALAGGGVAYKGSGSVLGHLGWDTQRKSFRLSERNGDLRVLSFTGQQGWFTLQDASAGKPASPATLTVLRERASDQSLQVVATLPNATRPAAIGKPLEQVYGVRFVGDRAYVVTFRQTDPLYVLDLSDPADPKTVGELEIAGFSEHLFPFDNGLLLGVGRSADPGNGRVDGLKVALFDVQDASRPRELGQFKLGTALSQLTLDRSRQGMNFLMRGAVARVAMPARLYGSTALAIDNGLLRFEVDTQARSLRNLPLRGVRSGSIASDLGSERSLQINDEVFYLHEGTIKAYAW